MQIEVEQIHEFPTIFIRYIDGRFSPVFSVRHKNDTAMLLPTDDPTRSSMLFKFQPPSVRWVLATRRRAGIPRPDDANIKLPEKVCPHAFYGGNTGPYKFGSISANDAHGGYRALAYSLFFDEDKYPLMRQLLSSYIVVRAGERWVQCKSFGGIYLQQSR